MTVKIITCAALLLAACGGTQPPKEEAKAPETRTEVKHGAEIALLKPDSKAGMTVNEALENRRSWREYAPEALSLEELSGVMWAAGGVNRPADGRLTAPSALALYPVRVYAFFAEGVYSYDAKARKLVRVAEGVHQIPAVHHVQALAHIEVPRETVVLPGKVSGNLTDRRRAMTAARAPGGRHIERHAGDDPVRIAFIRHKVHRQTQKAKGIGYQGVIVLMT